MSLERLSPNLYVRDMDASLSFYRDLLGFQVAMTVPESAPYNWAMVTSGGVTLMLETRNQDAAERLDEIAPALGDALILFIQTDDIRGLYESVKGRTAIAKDLHTTFYGMDEFALRDPDGFVLVFAQDAKEPQDGTQS